MSTRVYIVVHEVHYEYTDIIEVFNSRDSAFELAENEARKVQTRYNELCGTTKEPEKNDNGYHVSGESWTIEEWSPV